MNKFPTTTISGYARLLSEEEYAEIASLLNPDWVELLMGWPLGWTSLKPLPEIVPWGDWLEDWEQDTPRTRHRGEVPNRVARLKAIGNGQVPACMAAAWGLLSG